MRHELSEQMRTALKAFSSDTRLYDLKLDGVAATGMMVEAFRADEQLQAVGERLLIVLSTKPSIKAADLLGKSASLEICLADGSRTAFSGIVTHFSNLGGNGGLARYRLRLSPWLWLLGEQTNSRVWQDSSVTSIVESVLSAYQPQAKWRWSDDVRRFMQDCRPRSYCCQYRETDLGFLRRLLTEEGIAWRFEQSEGEARMVLFADSSYPSAAPEDASSAADEGIRFHGARSVERSDTIQALQVVRKLSVGRVTLLSYDYKAKRIVSTSVTTKLPLGGKHAPLLESFDCPGQYIFADSDHARHYAELQIQGHEARSKVWRVRSTVRSLRAGTRVRMTQTPMLVFGSKPAEFVVTRVISVGVNNLPAPVKAGLAELFGPVDAVLDLPAANHALPEFDLAIAQAQESGYGNCFEAIPAERPWRPMFEEDGEFTHCKATAQGSQSAIVVGRDGSDQPNGADEICCDRIGRVRIRFHWQDNTASCWVRVAQRLAGGGMGCQFLPRIGQEVLVQFMEGDIDRPVIVGALYNGLGEGGVAPTPGGRPASASKVDVFAIANDQRISGQGNLAGGNSPVWHGAAASPAGHANTGAQWGIRSKELGGRGYNQLLFDDTDGQGRVQLRSTHAATELNLGHLIHTADNYRGSFRGSGAELRTDAYGALRAGAGLLISSYTIRHAADGREAAGSNDEAIALIKQTQQAADSLSAAAKIHETVTFAAAKGDKPAPIEALWTMAAGVVSADGIAAATADAKAGKVEAGADKLPHMGAPIIGIAAKAGLAVVAGQDMQMVSGETLSIISGGDSQFVSGGQLRMHSGQAIGVLGGAEKPDESGVGLHLISAKDAIDLQAQADELKVQARDEINVISANAHVDWAAAKSISLSTAGGANITIAGGNITVQCPGKITVHAGMKSFSGPERKGYKLPVLPVGIVAPAEERTLESSFAFDQLTHIAKTFTKLEFVTFVVPIFGYDIPAETYIKLYEALRSDAIPQPEIKVMNGGHFPAAFDNESRTVLVHQAAADRATLTREESWDLLTALLHEFGHYIDCVLRMDLADKKPNGTSALAADAEGEEGARYAYAISFLDFAGSNETTYAVYSSPEFKGNLNVNYRDVRKAIANSQGIESQHNEAKYGKLEFFGAGRGEHYKDHPTTSFGRQSIEEALRKSHAEFKSRSLGKSIYFGNWLRDYSQIIDPSIVRHPNAPKNFPRKLSRQSLTELVDILAEDEFVTNSEEKKMYAVSKELLGVYRAVEHIDNPTNNAPSSVDPRTIDPDFDPRPSPEQTAVDTKTSLKSYIGHSRSHMLSQFEKAKSLGPTSEGCRHFGAGLHILEDYFAHSNFVELSLIKLGFTEVLPWTSPVAGKHRLPVVTGMFDKEDMIASTAGLIGDILFKVQWDFKPIVPGERTKGDRIFTILLREHSSTDLLNSWNNYLRYRDMFAQMPGTETIQRAGHNTVGVLINAQNSVFSGLAHFAGNSVGDVQVYMKGDPNTSGSTDPSHSQLAKDHDNHPFHTLAALLAKQAVEDTGKVMGRHWWDQGRNAEPLSSVGKFISHPFEVDWQDKYILQWAKAHASEIKRGASSTEWAALEKAHRKEITDKLKKLRSDSASTWKYVSENYARLFY